MFHKFLFKSFLLVLPLSAVVSCGNNIKVIPPKPGEKCTVKFIGKHAKMYDDVGIEITDDGTYTIEEGLQKQYFYIDPEFDDNLKNPNGKVYWWGEKPNIKIEGANYSWDIHQFWPTACVIIKYVPNSCVEITADTLEMDYDNLTLKNCKLYDPDGETEITRRRIMPGTYLDGYIIKDLQGNRVEDRNFNIIHNATAWLTYTDKQLSGLFIPARQVKNYSVCFEVK